jgi:hypothetical protein
MMLRPFRQYRDCGRLMIFDDGDHAFPHMEEVIHALRRETRT